MQSWVNYILSINSRPPTSDVWQIIELVNGFQFLGNIQFSETDDGKYETQAYDIANTLAEKYKKSSMNRVTTNHTQQTATPIYTKIRSTMIATDC